MSKNDRMDALASVLGRCTILGMAFLLVWAAVYFLAHDLIVAQGAWFGLSAHEVSVVHYAGMGLFKLGVFLFFLLPWAAVKLHQRSDVPLKEAGR